MHIEVVKCPCGFEMRPLVSGECYVTQPERAQWERLCLGRPRAANPKECRQLQALQQRRSLDRNSS